ncbi:DUF413 domain-containing protein [Litoribrevibacter albus]|uniref:Macrodomain Ori protein n=1 Tax=Litoribrevibacter albus TaxID=1473156 RepID=A0AA37S9K6_9GAMM|nr:DUF413 domain-containing protein [Litoribrevibacter albus]GLQ31740.1 UPF0438 protein YifE [Litoribrevibacter albus]
MDKNSFLSGRTFYDVQHFPNGFSREGVFSIRESELLSDCGHTISQLNSGSVEPQNPDQEKMLEFLQGKRDPETDLERIWSKYQTHLNKQYIAMRTMYTETGSSHQESDSSDF